MSASGAAFAESGHAGVTEHRGAGAGRRPCLGSPRTNLLPKYNIWANRHVASPLVRLRP
jgi:hypothetical protein